ncbi:MAG: hypothetical protein Q9203_003646 [Teloschistes exilis]
MSQYPGQQFAPAYWYQQYDPMAMLGQPNLHAQTDLADTDWNFSDTTFNAAAYETEQPNEEVPEQPSHQILEADLVERIEQVTKRLEERINNLNARLEEQEARSVGGNSKGMKLILA